MFPCSVTLQDKMDLTVMIELRIFEITLSYLDRSTRYFVSVLIKQRQHSQSQRCDNRDKRGFSRWYSRAGFVDGG